MRGYPQLHRYARRMRRKPTTAEALLWAELRSCGVRFRRQVPFPPYIVDFYCAAARLVVEVDGSAHDGHEARDWLRDRRLQQRGLTVLRLGNTFILRDPEKARQTVLRAAAQVGVRPKES